MAVSCLILHDFIHFFKYTLLFGKKSVIESINSCAIIIPIHMQVRTGIEHITHFCPSLLVFWLGKKKKIKKIKYVLQLIVICSSGSCECIIVPL